MSVITISSDFGNQNYLSGALKGQWISMGGSHALIDLNHHIPSYNFPQAAYLCRNAFRHFPEGTMHLILVNFFEVKPIHFIMATHQGQHYCCADNGLLQMILESSPDEAVAVPMDKLDVKNMLYVSSEMLKSIHQFLGGTPLKNCGNPVEIMTKPALKPAVGDNWMEGQIIYIDNFENVVVNIQRDEFETQRNGRSFNIEFRRDELIDKISESYADVPEGEKLALFNAAGFLEIAINQGNAAGLFGLEGYSENLLQNTGNSNKLLYQTVKVFFK